MHKRSILWILGTVAAASALVVMFRAQERRFQAVEQKLRAAEKERQESAARLDPGRPSAERALPPAAPESAPAPAKALEETKSEASGHSDTDARPSEEDQAAYVGVVFSQERIDGTWARQTERSIGDSLRGLAQDSSVTRIECRESLCKASVRHLDETKFSAFIDRLVGSGNETWKGEIYAHRDVGADGSVENTIYYAKPGQSIPWLE